MRNTITDPVERLRYNHVSLKNALRELEVDFVDGYKEFVMQCIFKDCTGHKRPFYLNCDLRAGQWHCFRCERTGHFDTFVKVVSGWTTLRVASFCNKHRAYDDPNDQVERNYEVQDVNDDLLRNFGHRHAYCYDRGIAEGILTRYRVGYDPNENAITFPWYDRVGKLIAIKMRSITDKQYRFICTGSFTHLLFGLHLIKPGSVVWLVEGEFDTMWLDQCFHQYSLKDHGACGLGGKHLHPKAKAELLQKNPQLVVLATDNDDDGNEAAKKIALELNGYVPTYRLEYPENAKDPNEVSFEWIVKQTTLIERTATLFQTSISRKYEQWCKEKTDGTIPGIEQS